MLGNKPIDYRTRPHWVVIGDQACIAKPYRQRIFLTWASVLVWRNSFSHFPKGLVAKYQITKEQTTTIRKIKGCSCYPLRPRKTNDK